MWLFTQTTAGSESKYLSLLEKVDIFATENMGGNISRFPTNNKKFTWQIKIKTLFWVLINWSFLPPNHLFLVVCVKTGRFYTNVLRKHICGCNYLSPLYDYQYILEWTHHKCKATIVAFIIICACCVYTPMAHWECPLWQRCEILIVSVILCWLLLSIFTTCSNVSTPNWMNRVMQPGKPGLPGSAMLSKW